MTWRETTIGKNSNAKISRAQLSCCKHSYKRLRRPLRAISKPYSTLIKDLQKREVLALLLILPFPNLQRPLLPLSSQVSPLWTSFSQLVCLSREPPVHMKEVPLGISAQAIITTSILHHQFHLWALPTHLRCITLQLASILKIKQHHWQKHQLPLHTLVHQRQEMKTWVPICHSLNSCQSTLNRYTIHKLHCLPIPCHLIRRLQLWGSVALFKDKILNQV